MRWVMAKIFYAPLVAHVTRLCNGELPLYVELEAIMRDTTVEVLHVEREPPLVINRCTVLTQILRYLLMPMFCIL
jgi:hypothetical protein